MSFLNIDPIQSPIPVQPGQHYTMGGVDVDSTGAAPSLKGFFAAGECSCVSVHGANRLGGNSLLETIVYGAIAGESAAKYAQGLTKTGREPQAINDTLKREEERIEGLKNRDGTFKPTVIKQQLARAMADKVGIFRDEQTLQETIEIIRELKSKTGDMVLSYRGASVNQELICALDTIANLDVAHAIVAGALARKESRALNSYRLPTRDDKHWLKHTIATLTPMALLII